MQETKEPRVQSLGQEDPLEEGMASHSSIIACKIPWTEEPGGLLQSIRRWNYTLIYTDWAKKDDPIDNYTLGDAHFA